MAAQHGSEDCAPVFDVLRISAPGHSKIAQDLDGGTPNSTNRVEDGRYYSGICDNPRKIPGYAPGYETLLKIKNTYLALADHMCATAIGCTATKMNGRASPNPLSRPPLRATNFRPNFRNNLPWRLHSRKREKKKPYKTTAGLLLPASDKWRPFSHIP